MCITFWTLDDPDYALIICSNRDEYLNRPTVDACFHSFHHHHHHHISDHESDLKSSPDQDSKGLNILSGIDEVGGGTWFGMTRSGKVALLTNITEPPSVFTSSRGSLVSSFLLSEFNIESFSTSSSNNLDSMPDLEDLAKKLYPREGKFAGFNLLLLAPRAPTTSNASFSASPAPEKTDHHMNQSTASSSHTSEEAQSHSLHYDAVFLTNSGAGGPITVRPLSTQETACGGFSNGIDGEGGSEWPKVVHGIKQFQGVISELRQAHGAQGEHGASSESVTTSGQEQDETKDRQLADRLFEVLTWRSPELVTERSHLRRTIQVAPILIGEKDEKMKGKLVTPTPPDITTPSQESPSSARLNWPTTSKITYYGTRLSTVLLIRRTGQVTFIERDIWKQVDDKAVRVNQGGRESERVFRFKLDSC